MTAPTNQPLSKENLDKFKQYKRTHAEWKNLHIVMEDKNIKDSHVQFCIDQCVKKSDTDGLELANILMGLSKSQRIKLAKQFD